MPDDDLILVYDSPLGFHFEKAFEKALSLRPKCNGVVFNGQFFRINNETTHKKLCDEWWNRTRS